MTLREHLFYSRKSVATFAKELGISRGYLDRIVNNWCKPSRMLAQYIEIMTGGEVKANELLGE